MGPLLPFIGKLVRTCAPYRGKFPKLDTRRQVKLEQQQHAAPARHPATKSVKIQDNDPASQQSESGRQAPSGDGLGLRRKAAGSDGATTLSGSMGSADSTPVASGESHKTAKPEPGPAREMAHAFSGQNFSGAKYATESGRALTLAHGHPARWGSVPDGLTAPVTPSLGQKLDPHPQ